MRMQTTFIALVLAVTAAPLAAQVTTRQDPRDRRPTSTTGTIADIIFGRSRVEGTTDCRVRDAVTPDGRIVQICDDRRARRDRDDDDDDREDSAWEHRRDGRGRRAHVNDRDGDGDFDARDRAIRKAEKNQLKAEKRRLRGD